MGDVRSSKRERKSLIMEDYVTTDSFNYDDEDYEPPSKRTQKRSSLTKRNSKSKTPEVGKAPRKQTEHFTPEESQAVFRFILSCVRSKAPGTEGRVAKRKFETSNNEVWEKCREVVGDHRDVIAYRNHYNFFSKKLHEFRFLTLEEKVDLYYAMDIRVDKSYHQKLIEEFGVEFDHQGVIIGSTLLTHWDIVHPDSDPEETELSMAPHRRNWKAFTEFEDGIMWQFVADDINAGIVRESYTRNVWEEFRRRYASTSNIKRSPETYRGRFLRILVPNLHIMPFDVMTKAVFYQHLGQPVPLEYRHIIRSAIDAKVDHTGMITLIRDRPERIFLQTDVYQDIIGITSTKKGSTLKSMSKELDLVPYTPEENNTIWDYILTKARGPGKTQRIKEKMTGWIFWQEFLDVVHTKRTWKSLSQHFVENLMENIMGTKYDLKAKMELYYALRCPIDEDVLKKFQEIATVVITNNRVMAHAVGKNFFIGRKERQGDFDDFDDNASQTEIKLTNHNIRTFMDNVAGSIGSSTKAENAVAETSKNSIKYPYVPQQSRPRGYYKMKKLPARSNGSATGSSNDELSAIYTHERNLDALRDEDDSDEHLEHLMPTPNPTSTKPAQILGAVARPSENPGTSAQSPQSVNVAKVQSRNMKKPQSVPTATDIGLKEPKPEPAETLEKEIKPENVAENMRSPVKRTVINGPSGRVTILPKANIRSVPRSNLTSETQSMRGANLYSPMRQEIVQPKLTPVPTKQAHLSNATKLAQKQPTASSGPAYSATVMSTAKDAEIKVPKEEPIEPEEKKEKPSMNSQNIINSGKPIAEQIEKVQVPTERKPQKFIDKQAVKEPTEPLSTSRTSKPVPYFSNATMAAIYQSFSPLPCATPPVQLCYRITANEVTRRKQTEEAEFELALTTAKTLTLELQARNEGASTSSPSGLQNSGRSEVARNMDTAFTEIEASIRLFNSRLKDVSHNLNDGQRGAYADRANALSRMFRCTTKDALAKPIFGNKQ